MLTKLIIKNYRCYENSNINLTHTSILVGRNNAGKSSLIESLKILSVITKKYKTSAFSPPPLWLKGELDNGISPSIDRLGLSSRGVFYMYREPPASIEAIFSNGTSIKVYIGENLSTFALIIGKDGVPARNSKEAKKIDIPQIEVLPQISAVLDTELIINEKTVDYNLPTRLTSRNFRNQLYYYNQFFNRFKQFAEGTWEHLQIKPVEYVMTDKGRALLFYVRDNSFESEIAWMGHGLQMWLQTMWFVSRCDESAIVVLDEPDVYMHADLQRRLIRLVSPLFSQLIVATHSVEIMDEVTPNCIIPIDSKRKNIKAIGNHAILQQLSEEMGSGFNLDLSRLFLSKRFMIWEGADTDRLILSAFQSVLFPQDLHPISSFPKVYVEGWGGWQRAQAVAEVFNQNNVQIKCYCVFDSDYHTEQDIEQRKQNAIVRHINLHIWQRKEIENYVIHPSVLLRFIKHNKRKGQVTEEIVSNKIQELVASMENEVITDVAEEIRMKDLKISIKTALEQARKCIKTRWQANPLYVIPGKQMIKELSSWSKKQYGISFNALNLVRCFHEEEVPKEIRDVITTIIEGGSF